MYRERSLCRLVLEKTITNPYKSSPPTVNRRTTAVPRADIFVDYLVCLAERKFSVKKKKGKKEREAKSKKSLLTREVASGAYGSAGVEKARCVDGCFYLETWEEGNTSEEETSCIYGDKV